MDKETKRLLAEAERQGFTVTVSRRGHPRVSLDGRLVATFAGSASDWRSVKNSLAAMRRAGFRWPPGR